MTSVRFTFIILVLLVAPLHMRAEAGHIKRQEPPSEPSPAVNTTTDDPEEEEAKYNEDEDKPVHGVCGLSLYRLPKRIRPTNYNLVVQPNLDTLTFEGSVQISVRVGASSPRRSLRRAQNRNGQVGANKIVLHADSQLSLDDIWYRELGPSKRSSASNSSSGKADYVELVSVCRDEHYQLVVITLARDLSDKSRGLLHLSFSGKLSASLRGFYKSSFFRPTNTSSKLYQAITQLQAVEARRLFPCFDEPAFKATFDVALVHRNNKLALSNMAPIYRSLISGEEGTDNGSSLVRFERTPPMSSYLLALFVGELDHIEHTMKTSNSGQQLQLRVYTPLGLNRLGRFALDVARRAIAQLEGYFGNDLPLKKLDLVPLSEFDSGAMENWGLITFEDSSLLVDDDQDPLSHRIYVACTIVHELAHQWFGNLVTMEWWNEVWLNEGMANWLEFSIMEKLFPEHDLSLYFLVKSHLHGLTMDSFRWSHPVELDVEQVESPADIDTLFDAISYNKASSIVRQTSEQMGHAKFRSAMQQYINKHKYANTNLDDLLEALADSGASKELNAFLLNWIGEPGHPLIRVTLINNSSNELLLVQERFIVDAESLDGAEVKQRWLVPITVLVRGFSPDDDSEQRAVIGASMNKTTAQTIQLPDWYDHKLEGNWLKLNVNFTGFYRVLYSEALQRSLHKAVEADELRWPADRINLLDDAYSLWLSKRLSTDHLLELMGAFSQETNGFVLEKLAHTFRAMLVINRGSAEAAKLSRFGEHLFGERIYQHGHLFKEVRARERPRANETYAELLGREALLELLSVDLNYKPLVRYLLEVFDEHTGTEGNLRRPPANLRSPVYKTVVEHGSQEQLMQLLALYKQAEPWQKMERQMILLALKGATSLERDALALELR